MLGNLRKAGFKGAIHLVNPRYPGIDGQATVPSIEALDPAPDLMIVTVPATEVPGLITSAVARLGRGSIAEAGDGKKSDALSHVVGGDVPNRSTARACVSGL